MDATTWLWVAVTVSAASALQSAIGFGAALFAVPLIVWAGVELPSAVALMMAVMTVQCAWGCFRVGPQVPWRAVGQLSVWRYLGIPVGVWTLVRIATWDQGRVEQLVGAIVVLAVAGQVWLRPAPRPRVHIAWTGAAGFSSGFLGGLTGMGGPPMVLWAMAHDWPARGYRSCVWAATLIAVPGYLTLFLWEFGVGILTPTAIGLALAPVTITSSQAGLWLGDRLSRARLRQMGLGLLLAIGGWALLGPLVRPSG